MSPCHHSTDIISCCLSYCHMCSVFFPNHWLDWQLFDNDCILNIIKIMKLPLHRVHLQYHLPCEGLSNLYHNTTIVVVTYNLSHFQLWLRIVDQYKLRTTLEWSTLRCIGPAAASWQWRISPVAASETYQCIRCIRFLVTHCVWCYELYISDSYIYIYILRVEYTKNVLIIFPIIIMTY